VYSSQPTAVKADAAGFVLERLRQTVTAVGTSSSSHDAIRLDRLRVAELQAEAQQAGFTPAGTETVHATSEYVGSEVVMLRA
jgi:hypothetical protein